MKTGKHTGDEVSRRERDRDRDRDRENRLEERKRWCWWRGEMA
jgi:hypothetical protein